VYGNHDLPCPHVYTFPVAGRIDGYCNWAGLDRRSTSGVWIIRAVVWWGWGSQYLHLCHSDDINARHDFEYMVCHRCEISVGGVAMSYAGEDYPYYDQEEVRAIMTSYKMTKNKFSVLHQDEDRWIIPVTVIVVIVVAIFIFWKG
jgi:hypothetical protein